MKRITIELSVEDAALVQGVLDNYAHFRSYSMTTHISRDKAQKIADALQEQVTLHDFQQLQTQAVS